MSQSTLSRRSFLRLTAVGLIGTALAACGASSSGAPVPTATPAAAGGAPAATATPAPAGGAPAATATPAPTPAANATPQLVPSTANTMTMMVWGGTTTAQQRDTAIRTVYSGLLPVNVITGGQGDQDVANTLRLALAAGNKNNIPDMVQFNKTEVPEFALGGQLVDLTSDVYGKYGSDLYTGALDLIQVNGKDYCFPYELKSKIFYYRADLFDQAGISLSNINSVSDLLSAGQTFHQKLPNSYLLNIGPQPAGYFGWEVLSAYPDPRFALDNGTYDVTTNKAFSDTFSFFKQIYDAKIALPIDDFSTDWQKGFTDNAIAGSFIASWMKYFLPKFVPEQIGKWKYSLWPQFSPLADQRYGSDAGGSVYVVYKNCAHPTQAIDYLTKVFLTKEGAMAEYNAQGTVPVIKSAQADFLALADNPVRPAGMSDADWTVQPANFFGKGYFDLELQSYNYLKTFIFDPASTKEQSIMLQWLNKYLTGAADLTTALQSAQNDMQGQIGNPYQS